MSREASPRRTDAQDWLQLDIDEAARAREQELALAPDIAIIDAHHHLWDGPVHRFDGHDFLVEASAGHRVIGSVFVECSAMYRESGPDNLRSVGETEYVNGIAAMAESGLYGDCRVAAGIVSFTDLCGDKVGRSLDLHRERAGERFKGIRYPVAWHPEPRFRHRRLKPEPGVMRRAAFRRGLDELARRGLSFDAWIYANQSAELAELATAYPETTFVVNHLAGPVGIGDGAGIVPERFEHWREAIAEVAACPNVVCKLGGLGMPLFGLRGERQDGVATSVDLAAAWSPLVLSAIEAFGADRCLFESNFPMDKETCGYVTLWNAFKRIVAHLPWEAQASLFHETAARAYRLDLPLRTGGA